MAPVVRLLYVDDEPSLLEIGKLFLEDNGEFVIDTFTSARVALTQIKTIPYDAIVSDYQMPGMDGIAFLKQLRGSGNSTPFILFTGRGREEVVIEALNNGADFYIQKGGEPRSQFAELSHKIRQSIQQRQAMASIRDHERREADIINFLPDATFAVDTNGVVIAWNRAMEKMTGVASDQILGKGNYEYALPFYLERRPILIDLVLKDDPVTAGKYPFIKRDGTTLVSEITIPHFNNGHGATLWFIVSPLYDRRGTIVGAIESIREITERKQAEEALAKSGTRLQRAERVAGLGHWEFCLETRDVYGSDGARSLYGISNRHWSISEVQKIPLPEYRPILDEALRALVEDNRLYDVEFRIQRPTDGKVLDIHSIAEYDPTTQMVFGVIQDITERKRQDHILKTQLDLGLALQSVRGLHDTLEICLNGAIEISGMDAGGIYLVDGRDGSIDLIVSRNLGTEFVQSASHYSDSSANTRMVMGGKPIYMPFCKTGMGHPKVWEKEGLKAAAIIPILYHSRVIACLNISSHTVEEYPPNARIALETIATQIGSAIERIRADETLADSEVRYRNIVEDQTEFISRFLPDGTHVFVNEAYCRYFGLKRDDILGHPFRPDIPAEDKDRVSNFFASLTPDNPVDIIDHRIIMQDGNIRWQRWSDRAIFDPSGKVTEYQSVGRDVSDKKVAEIALLASEKRFHLLAENLQDPVIILGFDASVQYANNAAFHLVGIPPTLDGDNVSITPFLDKESQERAIADLDMIRVSGGPRVGEYRMRTAQGEMKWVEAVGIRIPWRGTDQDLVALRDITERKQAEETLCESENKFASVFYGSPVALTLVSAIDGTFVDVNGAFVTATGYSRDEVIGVTSEALGIFEDGGERERLASTLRTQRTVHDMEIKCRTKTGEIRPCLFSSGLILIGGRPHILSTIRDITDRKRAEDALKMANRKLKLLSGITRHDINNQLLVLRGFLGYLGKKQPDLSSNKDFQKIATAAERISSMIQFTKEYEQVGIKSPTWQDCRTLVDTVAKDVPLGKVKLKNTLTDNTEVFADPLIVKVFYNMMDNAVRYGGKITTIRFALKEHDGCHVIVCEDDGDGVPAEEKERIFDRGIGKNTGLGLALSREILDITGISICETGEPGKGARFEMTVPKGAWRVVDVNRKANLP